MSEVTRGEFNGLGQRVDRNREDFVECRASNGQAVATMAETLQAQGQAITRLFQGQEDIKVGFAGMKGRLWMVGAIIALFIPILTAIIIRATDPGKPDYGRTADTVADRNGPEIDN